MDDAALMTDRIACADADLSEGPTFPENADHSGGADQQTPSDELAQRMAARGEPTEAAAEANADVADGQPQPMQIIEALLFASDAPLSAGRLAECAGDCTPGQVRRHIAALNERYAAAGLSFRISEIARGFQMLTEPEFQPWLARLNRERAQTRLTGAALETLSIIAYKQPVIRAEIEAIRGVACGEVMNRLREMGLIKIVGRAEVVGRPLLYGTTKRFLDTFGLADVDDLPPLEALTLRRKLAEQEQARADDAAEEAMQPADHGAPEAEPQAAQAEASPQRFAATG